MLPTIERLHAGCLRLQGFRSRCVPTSQGRLHLLEASGRGDLPPFLLIHGLGSRGADFGPLLRRLRRHARRVVAIDLPGHGGTEAPRGGMHTEPVRAMVTEALDRVLDVPAVLVGSSLGGAVALRHALDRPGRVCGLVLASPAGGPMTAEALRSLAGQLRLETHRDALAFVDRVHAKPPSGRHLLAWATRRRMRCEPVQRLLAAAVPEDLFTPAEVSTLQAPVLLVWGRQERVLPREHLEFYRRCLPPTAVVEEPPDVGHAPFLDRPADFARRVVRFAEGCAASPAR